MPNENEELKYIINIIENSDYTKIKQTGDKTYFFSIKKDKTEIQVNKNKIYVHAFEVVEFRAIKEIGNFELNADEVKNDYNYDSIIEGFICGLNKNL